jgi:hypothetical protein
MTVMIVVSDLRGRTDASFNPIKLYVSKCSLYSSNWCLFIAGTQPIPGSSVGVATGYGLDGQGIESR